MFSSLAAVLVFASSLEADRLEKFKLPPGTRLVGIRLSGPIPAPLSEIDMVIQFKDAAKSMIIIPKVRVLVSDCNMRDDVGYFALTPSQILALVEMKKRDPVITARPRAKKADKLDR